MLGCDYLEPSKGIGPKTALKLIREHNGLEGAEKFIRAKMADKAEENAIAMAQAEESEPESEEGEGPDMPASSPGAGSASSPKKKVIKKKKVTSAGMQLPEYWPWREAKKLFIQPDVQKADDMDVSVKLKGTRILS